MSNSVSAFGWKLKSSLKMRLKIKGRVRDLFDLRALRFASTVKRLPAVRIGEEVIRRAAEKLPDSRLMIKDVGLASSIWEPILANKIQALVKDIEEGNFCGLLDKYESLFRSNLMDGAVSHADDLGLLTRLTSATRFHRWEKLYRKESANLQEAIGSIVYDCISSEIYNYGQPLAAPYGDKWINIECLDEAYFAIKIVNLLESIEFSEIVFIGDGAGLLAPIVISINEQFRKKQCTSYVLVDFAHFALATMLRIPLKFYEFLTILSPSSILRQGDLMTNQSSSGYGISECTGNRLIVNQDSFPEISPDALNAYLSPSAGSTWIASYNQVKLSKVHSDYSKVILDHGYELCGKSSSALRSNYSISIFSTPNKDSD